MISVAASNKYEIDDNLLDKIAIISTMSANMGEIIGPIFSGVIADTIGLQSSCAVIGIATLAYGVLYFFGSGFASTLHSTKKQKSAVEPKDADVSLISGDDFGYDRSFD